MKMKPKKNKLPTNRRVKYEVTGDFGTSEIGDVCDAYVLFDNKDNGNTLVYHPSTEKDMVGSLSFVVEQTSGNYVSQDNEQYINLTDEESGLVENLLRKLSRSNDVGYTR